MARARRNVEDVLEAAPAQLERYKGKYNAQEVPWQAAFKNKRMFSPVLPFIRLLPRYARTIPPNFKVEKDYKPQAMRLTD